MVEIAPICEFNCTSLLTFHKDLILIHTYMSIPICIIGIITNTVNIIIFTRKIMESPTNFVFTCLATADLLFQIAYICFILYSAGTNSYTSLVGLIFAFIVTNFVYLIKSISTWLTVVLGGGRYIAVVHPHQHRNWSTMENMLLLVVGGCLLCLLLQIPFFLMVNIDTKSHPYKIWWAGKTTNTLLVFNFVCHGVFIKLIPSITLTIFTIRTIYVMKRAKITRQTLTSGSNRNDKERRTNRVWKMVLMVLISFLITEIPAGILSLLNIPLGCTYYLTYYINLITILDMLLLTNAASKFFIYYTMSKKFRSTFKLLLNRNTFPEGTDFRLIG